jgi:hypothetical protein
VKVINLKIGQLLIKLEIKMKEEIGFKRIQKIRLLLGMVVGGCTPSYSGIRGRKIAS